LLPYFSVIGAIGDAVRSGIREVRGTAVRSDNYVERDDVMLRRVRRVMSTEEEDEKCWLE
jgi:hypothetical protein